LAGLSARYGAALFDIAQESGVLDDFHIQALRLRNALDTPECHQILQHPGIPDAQKGRFLSDAFGPGTHQSLMGFMHLLIAKSREALLVPSLDVFLELSDRHQGKAKALLVCAAEPGQSQIDEVKTMLSAKMDKHVELTVKTDPSLIGGFYVSAEGFLLDRSLRKKLQDLKNHLKRGATHEPSP